MPVNVGKYREILAGLGNVTLVAVSKIKPVEDIRTLYELGQRDFGENYVQELVDKHAQLPADIRWHFIGHLQSNKVKYLASFVHLIQGVDSAKLLKEIDRQAQKCGRVIDCLLQVHIAQEETKFGFDEEALDELFKGQSGATLKNVRVRGLMGMASFSKDSTQVRREFRYLKSLFDKYALVVSVAGVGGGTPIKGGGDGWSLQILSMGMSGDYQMAIEEGSNMIRVGSLLFGERVYPAK
ncbi:MAG: YggS family pyridoxal phosphate-dependent enzyme [Puia sp.]|nr:YggS family pyridoxal phosphate-dependent enzyme [Puia sp.]